MDSLSRHDLVLAALAASGGGAHSPVQVQKLFFLIDENIAASIGGKQFDFQPKDYGPFDGAVYSEISALAREGLAEIELLSYPPGRQYRLTPEGQARGQAILDKRLQPQVGGYVKQLSTWVRSQPFAQLVAAIYKKYPAMQVNSVFRETK
jgi:hypothetical protein